MNNDNLLECLSYTIYGLAKQPLIYLNGLAIAVSISDVEAALKILLYAVSIISSLLVSRKYYLEIKKLENSRWKDLFSGSKKKKNGE